MPPSLFNPDDPLLIEAAGVVARLAGRGITVFHNPSYGIMLMGATPESPAPSKADMDSAYGLHNEIAILFAMQSLTKVSVSMKQCQSVLDELKLNSAVSTAAKEG